MAAVGRPPFGESKEYCICRSSDISRFMIGCDNCDEWYHGDCIDISQTESSSIKKYYCMFCRQKDSSLTVQYLQPSDIKPVQNTRPCGMCANCNREYDCKRCEVCLDNTKYGGPGTSGKTRCKNRECSNPLSGQCPPPRRQQRPAILDDSSSGSEYEPPNITASKSVKRTKQRSELDSKRKRSGRLLSVATGDDSDDEDEDDEEESNEPRQCYGPGCIDVAREGSKYCSDECGLKLANNRIFEILPAKIKQWQASKCVAEERNKLALEEIRKTQDQSRKKLMDLDKKHRELDEIVQAAKNVTVDEDEESDNEEETETEQTMFCVTCGHEYNMKNAVKHMEKCFNKVESQTSFGSRYQTKIEGYALFCDHYNKHNKNYCKRLKVLCPEHTKEPRVANDEVCGCPLVKDLFTPTGEFCRQAKRNCVKHYKWEKLRRAEIDQERLRQLMRLEELFERERNLRVDMANRAGLMGLLLHNTLDHDSRRPMKVPPPTTTIRPIPNQ